MRRDQDWEDDPLKRGALISFERREGNLEPWPDEDWTLRKERRGNSELEYHRSGIAGKKESKNG